MNDYWQILKTIKVALQGNIDQVERWYEPMITYSTYDTH